MFCRYCGERIPGDSRFCPKCGKALDQPTPEAPKVPSKAPVPEAPNSEPVPKTASKWKVPELSKLPKAPRGKGKLPFIPIVVALAAVLVLVVAMCGGGDKPGPKGGYASSPVSSRSASKPTVKPSAESTETPAASGSAIDGYLEDQTITYESGAVYEGQTLGGVPWGKGRITYAEDDSAERLYYEGEWNNGEREGRGTMAWSSGLVFRGEWDNDTRNGPGVLTTADGSVYTGNYVDGKREGDFVLVTASGKVYALVFDKGDEVSRTEITDPKKVAAAIAGELTPPPLDSAAPKATAAPDPTSTPKPTPVPTSAEDADGQLPDLATFFQCDRNEDQLCSDFGSDGRLVSVKFGLDDGKDGVDEYIGLLKEDRYHLTLRNTQVQDYTSTSGSKFVTYYFDYDGDKTVGLMHDGSKGPTAPVYVLVGYHYGEGRIGLALYYGSGLALSDPGGRASTLPEDLVGSSSSGPSESSSGSSSGPAKVEVKCYKCKGEGKITCTECDGKGYKSSYVSAPNYSGKSTTSKEARTTCSKCKGIGTIECPKCHGSGKI